MRLVVIDAANCIYRAFFALPPLRSSGGTPTNAVLGFVNMLNKVVREEAPDYLAVVFDAPGKSFRHQLFADYKATRDAQPEDLSVQFPLVREVIDAYRFPMLEVPGVEADDVIATLVERAPEDLEIAVVSTDKDLMQLVSERVALLDTMKDRRVGPAEVEERLGVPPEKVLDVRALVGDPSDNIPGVKGIGGKGAAKLIDEWGDLENLLEHASDVKAKRAREALQEQADIARLSKELSTLRRDVELPCQLEDLRPGVPDTARLHALFSDLGFTRLLESLDAGAAASAPSEPARDVPILKGAAGLRELAAAGEGGVPPAVVLVEGTRPDAAATARPFALGVARGEDAGLVLLQGGAEEPAALGELFAGGWIARDTNRVQRVLGDAGVDVAPPSFDVDLGAFLLDPAAQRTTTTLAHAYLDRNVRSFEEVAGRGAKATPVESLLPNELAAWAAGEAAALRDLAPILRDRLEEDGLLALFEDVELPLAAVLARMERSGVRVDEGFLGELSTQYQKELSRIEAEIYGLAGEEFLVSSPKQLQRILFEKLKLPPVKKTKTGFSTDEKVLEQLSAQHELPAAILAYRRLAKLKSTYVDALPRLVNPETGRIHPSFHQTGAATGRLSCTDPNLQNIPIRTEEGVRIREAFIPAEGMTLLSADYSQVELRILAHYSGDESLIEAFEKGEDVHRRTAAEVAGIDPNTVTAEQRARAKAINFGIIYGSTAFGIANQLGIASADAQATIDTYFERYRGVRRFLDETIRRAREEGFVRTLLGRRRWLPDLTSRNRVLRQAGERMAVNTVIQGTAADLIKKTMVEVHEALAAEAPEVRMILQVHDELVFEVPTGAVDPIRERVRDIMQGVYALRVPLEVEVGVGATWREAH
ncbi:MAG: DNA polymerase I [Deltaproteobacteria bacterium]|nr:DNA polymerase I [Deltaproteobacteria bacterium]